MQHGFLIATDGLNFQRWCIFYEFWYQVSMPLAAVDHNKKQNLPNSCDWNHRKYLVQRNAEAVSTWFRK